MEGGLDKADGACDSLIASVVPEAAVWEPLDLGLVNLAKNLVLVCYVKVYVRIIRQT